MGRTYAEDGQAQARAVMADLAASPHTARHLATKIARHFVSDDPPPALVDRLTQAYLASGGRLDVVARALINSPEAWSPTPAKFKTPYEFMVSSWRAADTAPEAVQPMAQTLNAMGQKPFSAPSPKGWPEEAEAWCAPDAVIKRMAWTRGLRRRRRGRPRPDGPGRQRPGRHGSRPWRPRPSPGPRPEARASRSC